LLIYGDRKNNKKNPLNRITINSLSMFILFKIISYKLLLKKDTLNPYKKEPWSSFMFYRFRWCHCYFYFFLLLFLISIFYHYSYSSRLLIDRLIIYINWNLKAEKDRSCEIQLKYISFEFLINTLLINTPVFSVVFVFAFISLLIRPRN